MDLDPASERTFSWRPRPGDVFGVAALFAVTRILLIAAGAVAWDYQSNGYVWRGKDPGGIRYALVPAQPLLDMWTRWDSWEYEEIARQGYWYDPHHQPHPYGTVACFPVYPLTVRAVGVILGGRYVIAGLAVSNLSALVGFVLLFQWADWWGSRRAAWVTVAAAITFPAGLFWSALYPQSLVFCLSIASLLLMMDGRVAAASVFGALVAATRMEGIAILAPLLAIDLQQRHGRIGWQTLWLALTPLGVLAYMAYLYHRFGDPLLFLKLQTIFGRSFANPIQTLILPLTRPSLFTDVGVIMTYIAGALLLLGHKARLRWPILLYGWLMFTIPLCTGVYMSIYRVHLVNFPIYLALGLGLGERWRFLTIGILLFFEAFQAAMMFGWVAGWGYP